MITNIYSLVREVKENYENDDIDTVEGLSFNMYDTVREVEFLTSGHYLSGDYDENGDLKPFHDIITRILENQRTAEEIDTKDMDITTNDPEYYTRAMLVSKWNQDWMAENHIDKFINDAIEVRGKVGGLLVKVIEDGDNLSLEVGDWNSFSGDAADLNAGLKVFDHFYTPAGLIEVAMERGWDMDEVHDGIEMYAQADQDDDLKEQRETTGKYVLVREISGVMEKQYMDKDADEHEYSYQMHYVLGAEFHSEQDGERGKTLSSVELEESPYYFLPYKKRTTSGKMLGIGMTERSRHGQIQTNKGAQWGNNSMDFASLHVLQSSSKNLKGKNILTNMKRGTILKTDDGKPISGVDMSPQALAHLGNFMAGWQNQVDRATGTFAVATGEELPSGTPYRLGAILDQNAQSAFDLRREEMAIFLNRIYTERVIPFFIKQMKSKAKLALKFTPDELKKLDKDVSQYKADQTIIKKYLDGGFDNVPPVMKFAVMDTEREQMMEDVDKELKKGRNRRTITSFPKGYWEQVADKLYVDITGERRDKGTVLESVNNVLLQYLQYKPQLDADPEARKLFNNTLHHKTNRSNHSNYLLDRDRKDRQDLMTLHS
jgi:hypothetical protein